MRVLIVGAIVLVMLQALCEATSIAKCSRNDNRPVELETTSGKLMGLCDFVKVNDNNPRVTRDGNVYSFLGVPYAEPPINQYRFKAPVEVRQRQEPIDATRWPNACMQNSYKSDSLFTGYSMWTVPESVTQLSEDCLYLNVWLPAEAFLKNTVFNYNLEPTKSPIMVFFHGGGSVQGSTSVDIYNPATFVAATNTIVITVNYRLGVFGGLYIEDEFPGNQALLDQNEALRWVRNNAEAMGGDASRITIVGQSSGAAHVGYHLLFKDSWQLFNNAILQSGTPFLNPPITRAEASRRARELLTLIGCANETSSDADAALCAQSAPHIGKAATDFHMKLTQGDLFRHLIVLNPFGIVVDGRVLTDTPQALFDRGDFKKCPVMTGYLIDEGSMFAGYSSENLSAEAIRKRPKVSHADLKNIVKKVFNYYPAYPTEANPILLDAVLHEYTKILDVNPNEPKSALLKPNYFHVLSKIIGDALFTCPTYKMIDLLAKHSPNNLYLYLFAHRVSSTPWPSWYGATHGDDLAFAPFAHTVSERDESTINGVNPWANPRHRYSSGEKLLTNEMISYWSAFAKSGESPNTKNNMYWPEYTLFKEDFTSDNMTDVNESVRYIIFKSTGIRVNRGYSLEICQFWNSYIDRLLKENENQLKSAGQKNGGGISPACEIATANKQQSEHQPSAVRQRMSESNGKLASSHNTGSMTVAATTTVFFSLLVAFLHVFY